MNDNLKIFLIVLSTTLLLGLLSLLTFRMMFVDYVDQTEFAYMVNRITGSTDTIKKKGYVVSAPVVKKVYTIDLRPVQICLNVNTMNTSRVLNCKLVRFNSAHFKEFISIHGVGSYDPSSLQDYLKIYAFDDSVDPEKDFPFLIIEKEFKTNNAHETKIDSIK